MRTLLVLSEHPGLADEVRAGVDAEQYRVIHRTNLDEAEPLLVHGLADACILDLELTNVQGIWALERLRRRAPKCPVVVYSDARGRDWEEEAYLQGATHVLNKPVRPRMLRALLGRVWPAESSSFPVVMPVPAQPFQPVQPPEGSSAAAAASSATGLLRHFSGILTHSLS